jgi:hypothetical protein
MALSPHDIGELPDQLTADILTALKADSKFCLADVMRAADLTIEQIATYGAALATSDSWHGRLDLDTRDRIRVMCELAFTPAEPEAPDLLAASAQQIHDPWQRHAQINEYVTTLQGAGKDVVVTYSDGEEGSAA